MPFISPVMWGKLKIETIYTTAIIRNIKPDLEAMTDKSTTIKGVEIIVGTESLNLMAVKLINEEFYSKRRSNFHTELIQINGQFPLSELVRNLSETSFWLVCFLRRLVRSKSETGQKLVRNKLENSTGTDLKDDLYSSQSHLIIHNNIFIFHIYGQSCLSTAFEWTMLDYWSQWWPSCRYDGPTLYAI